MQFPPFFLDTSTMQQQIKNLKEELLRKEEQTKDLTNFIETIIDRAQQIEALEAMPLLKKFGLKDPNNDFLGNLKQVIHLSEKIANGSLFTEIDQKISTINLNIVKTQTLVDTLKKQTAEITSLIEAGMEKK